MCVMKMQVVEPQGTGALESAQMATDDFLQDGMGAAWNLVQPGAPASIASPLSFALCAFQDWIACLKL